MHICRNGCLNQIFLILFDFPFPSGLGAYAPDYLFGDGQFKLNPIDGKDLAVVCVDKMIAGNREETAGGQEILTQEDIAKIALRVLNKPLKITFLPDWTRKLSIWVLRTFTSSKAYGPFEFSFQLWLRIILQINMAS